MIDWNNDGQVDPTEIVLTDIIIGEHDDEELTYVAEETVKNRNKKTKESWSDKLFGRRRDV